MFKYYMHVWTRLVPIDHSDARIQSLRRHMISRGLADVLVYGEGKELPCLDELSYVDFDLLSGQELGVLAQSFEEVALKRAEFALEISEMLDLIRVAQEAGVDILFDPFGN